MTTKHTSNTQLFPKFDFLFVLINGEIEDLCDESLDFTSESWAWSRWSIRMQLSHMASLVPRWIIVRLGHILYPNGDHGYSDLEPVANSKYDRRLDEDKYWEISEIMSALAKAIDLVRDVLSKTSIEVLRGNMVQRDPSPQWKSMSKAHTYGVTATGDPAAGTMTIEATIRHIYFELTTHLFNIQRLKKAQGLKVVSNIPRVGYWVLPDWDVSQP